jgi:GH25 family lysozyme M1 (1,4-beta-N-acetylmuramidase)
MLFAYIKATEGNYYVNPEFAQQYDGAYSAGLIRGGYTFGNPDSSNGASQAKYFVEHGGGWSADGMTLPGALDIEYNPYDTANINECYNYSASAMRTWITQFIDEYRSLTGVWPMVYSTTNWWATCTDNWTGAAKNDPFWLAAYGSSPGAAPAGYGTFTIWQFTSQGILGGDEDVFNGGPSRLITLARNG